MALLYRRARVTGPGFPVAVMRCGVHGGAAFTVYPPGHVPYGRQAVVPVGVEGVVLRDGESGLVELKGTLFEAALDASAGARWSSGSPADDDRRRRTQLRRVVVAMAVLGVAAETSAAVQERQAHALGVPTMVLRSGRQQVLEARDWTARGQGVVAVLRALGTGGSLLDRVLWAGALGGLWAVPRRWEPASRSYVGPCSEPPERPPKL